MGIQDQDWDGWFPLCHLEMQKIFQRFYLLCLLKCSSVGTDGSCACAHLAHLVHLAPSSHFNWSVCHHFQVMLTLPVFESSTCSQRACSDQDSNGWRSSPPGGFTFDGQGRWAFRRTEAKPDAFLTTMEEIGVQHQNASCLGVKRCLIIFSRRRRLCQTAPQPHLTWRLIYGDTSLTFG